MLRITLFIILIISFGIYCEAQSLPNWISSGKNIICTAEGIEPQNILEVAESKCLASAAKSQGVTVNVSSKTVQSISGADSSEVTEISPLKADIQCEWTNRFMERTKDTYRVWLECTLKKLSVSKRDINYVGEFPVRKHKRASATLVMVPKGDIIMVGYGGGQRAIEVKSNVQQIILTQDDEWIEIQRHGYKHERQRINGWSDGDVVNFTFNLTK